MEKKITIGRSHVVQGRLTPKRVLVYAGLIFWAIVNLFPLYWLFTFSLKSKAEIFGDNVAGLPQNWLWGNYTEALKMGNFGRLFFNSIVVAVVTILITLIAALMATYAMTRLIWKRRHTMNKVFMLGLTIPIHASIVPIFIVLNRLNMTDTYWALIIPYAAFSLSMGILVCTGFMNDLPRELDESACIDGCGVWGVFFRIIMPLMKPAVATVGIYTFLQCWNELMFATIFTNSEAMKTLPVGIQGFIGRNDTNWGLIGASMVIGTFPMLLVYVFLSRQIQDSFVAGAVKG